MQEEKPQESSSSSDSDSDIPVTVDDVYSEYEGLTGQSSGAQRSYQSPTLYSVASNSLTRITSSISPSRGHMSS